MDSTASYKFNQTFCKTLTQHQRELLFVLTLWCYIHWLAGSEKGPAPSLDRGPSPWPSVCRRAPTEDAFPLLKPQAAYCSDTISHVSLRWASPWRQMANRRESNTRLNRVSQDQRGRHVHMLPNTFKRNNQHFNSTHPTHTHTLPVCFSCVFKQYAFLFGFISKSPRLPRSLFFFLAQMLW